MNYDYPKELQSIKESHYYTIAEMAKRAGKMPLLTLYNVMQGWVKNPRRKTRLKLNAFIDKYKGAVE